MLVTLAKTTVSSDLHQQLGTYKDLTTGLLALELGTLAAPYMKHQPAPHNRQAYDIVNCSKFRLLGL